MIVVGYRICVFFIAIHILLTGSVSYAKNEYVEYIENVGFKPVSAEINSYLSESFPNYENCNFVYKEIVLEGRKPMSVYFITTDVKCWGAARGPILLFQKNPEFSVLLDTVNYGMEFEQSMHNGINDLRFTSGTAGAIDTEKWVFDGKRFNLMENKNEFLDQE